jgi:hypothetical protein
MLKGRSRQVYLASLGKCRTLKQNEMLTLK